MALITQSTTLKITTKNLYSLVIASAEDIAVMDLDMPKHGKHVLLFRGYSNLKDLVNHRWRHVIGLRGLGPKCCDEIRKYIQLEEYSEADLKRTKKVQTYQSSLDTRKY